MKNEKILVVEFEETSLNMLSETLRTEGFQVVTAKDGHEGLLMFEAESPDLVILEPMLLKLHGFDLCRKISEDSRKSTPVIITTGFYKGEHYRSEAIETFGASAFFEKPYKDEDLLVAIHDLLGNGTSERVKDAKEINKDVKEIKNDVKEIKKIPAEKKIPSVDIEESVREMERSIKERVKSPAKDDLDSLKMGKKAGAPGLSAKVDEMLQDALSDFGLSIDKKPADKIKVIEKKQEKEDVQMEKSIEPSNDEEQDESAEKKELKTEELIEELIQKEEKLEEKTKHEDEAAEKEQQDEPEQEAEVEHEEIEETIKQETEASGIESEEIPEKKMKAEAEVKDTGTVAEVEAVEKEAVDKPEEKLRDKEDKTEKEVVREEIKDGKNKTDQKIFEEYFEDPEKRAPQKKILGFLKKIRKSLPLMIGSTAFVVLVAAGATYYFLKPDRPPKLSEQESTLPISEAERSANMNLPSSTMEQELNVGNADESGPALNGGEGMQAENPATQNSPSSVDLEPVSTTEFMSTTRLSSNKREVMLVEGTPQPQSRKFQSVEVEETGEEKLEDSNIEITSPGLKEAVQNIIQSEETSDRIKIGDLVPIESVDEPPVAKSKVNPKYPAAAFQRGIEATVAFRALISEFGNVLDIVFVNPKGVAPAFKNACEDAVRQWRFSPAKKNGVNVKVWKTFSIAFKKNKTE